MGCVYLVWADGTCRYKIGMTSSETPESRLVALQTGSPYKLHLVGYISTETPDQVEMEQHHKWGYKRVSGEWFEFGPWDLPQLAKDFGFVSIQSALDQAISSHADAFSECLTKHYVRVLETFMNTMTEKTSQVMTHTVIASHEVSAKHVADFVAKLTPETKAHILAFLQA